MNDVRFDGQLLDYEMRGLLEVLLMAVYTKFDMVDQNSS